MLSFWWIQVFQFTQYLVFSMQCSFFICPISIFIPVVVVIVVVVVIMIMIVSLPVPVLVCWYELDNNHHKYWLSIPSYVVCTLGMDNNDQITNQKIQSQQRASFRPKIELKENKDYFCHYSSMDMNIRNLANNWQSSFWHLASISLSIMVERLHATDRTEGNVIHGIDKVCFIYPLDNTVHER